MRRRINFAVLLLAVACATSIGIPANKYGLHVVPDYETYMRLVHQDPQKELIDLSRAIPTAAIDVRYATANNFMHQPLYPIAKAFLRAPAARALESVQKELAGEGLGLRIYDGYRPYSVTERMWEPIRNPDFVADPAKGSRHNRGAAVDLTIIDLETREEIPLPTPYDDFTSKAAHSFKDLPENVLRNRSKLAEIMTRHGFEPLPSEWWHFDFRGWQNFELMDVPLEVLAKMQKPSSPGLH